MTFRFPVEMPYESRQLTGWGRTHPVTAQVVQPRKVEELQKLINNAKPRSLIARGLGRSYGDAAHLKNGTVIELPTFNQIELDPSAGTATAGAGASLDQILRVIVPQGFFLPVTPGTRNVTVGGAIAADVHGKNHHVDGSFGNHVERIILVDGGGTLREVTPNGDCSSLFWSTVGGMGLTGVIVSATFSLIPITTSLMSVDTKRYRDLESLMDAMIEADTKYRYSVAWVDSLDDKGRGVLTCGDHVQVDQLNEDQKQDPLQYDPRALASTPPLLPAGLLNKLTVRTFNEAWYRKAPKHRVGELQRIATFFHPLDGVKDWNRIYGPAGFLQYQFAIPDEAAHLVPRALKVLREAGANSFLTVLKRFGDGNPAPLSFPIKGWTLAVDVPAGRTKTLAALDALDQEVISSGGRIYLAKDARQSKDTFKQTYRELERFRSVIASCDTEEKFRSSLWLRLT